MKNLVRTLSILATCLLTCSALLAQTPQNTSAAECCRIGTELLYKQQFVEAAKWLQQAADQKYMPAYYLLARCYDNANSPINDYNKAFYYYGSALDMPTNSQDYWFSCWRLGAFFEFGYGTEINYDSAIFFYTEYTNSTQPQNRKIGNECIARVQEKKRAAASGGTTQKPSTAQSSGSGRQTNTPASGTTQKSAQDYYDEGRKLLAAEKYSEARACFEKAEEMLGGNANCEYGIGMTYMQYVRDRQKAIFWFHKAAEKGLADAQAKLGVWLDGEESIMWFRKAAKQGHTLAQKYLRDNGIDY